MRDLSIRDSCSMFIDICIGVENALSIEQDLVRQTVERIGTEAVQAMRKI